MGQHTISSVIVLRALSCHQVESVLRLQWPAFRDAKILSVTEKGNSKLLVTCNGNSMTQAGSSSTPTAAHRQPQETSRQQQHTHRQQQETSRQQQHAHRLQQETSRQQQHAHRQQQETRGSSSTSGSWHFMDMMNLYKYLIISIDIHIVFGY